MTPSRRKERNAEMTKKLMMMAAAFGAWAETETAGGRMWTYQINGGTAENLV